MRRQGLPVDIGSKIQKFSMRRQGGGEQHEQRQKGSRDTQESEERPIRGWDMTGINEEVRKANRRIYQTIQWLDYCFQFKCVVYSTKTLRVNFIC